MRRRELLRELRRHGVVFVREGAGHSIYRNPRTGVLIPVPRHVQINENLVRKIMRDASE